MMQHQCNRDVLRTLRLIARSGAKAVLMTTFRTDDGFENTDLGCASGGYRPQDLEKPPFSLPPPLAFFSEEYPLDSRVGLGLWKPHQLH